MSSTVIIVMLRKPKRADPSERRSDPFYELGSYGCTGCHGDTLLHHRNRETLKGARLAFAQGGSGSIKLVCLTPPIQTRECGGHLEALWDPASGRFFRYKSAPTLASNSAEPDFPSLAADYNRANRPTPMARFASCFRSRVQPLDPGIAKEIVEVFERFKNEARDEDFAKQYWETMETPPPVKDTNRLATYTERRAQAGSCRQRSSSDGPHRIGGCG
jgi:hypothetical protein